MGRIPLSEQELTVIMTGDCKRAQVYCCQHVWLGRLMKAADLYPDEVRIVREDEYGATFELPTTFLFRPSIRPPKSISLSEEERAAIAARLHGRA